MKQYILDGKKIVDLNSFFKTFGEMVNGPGGEFGRNYFSFNDRLYGGFGLEIPCRIIWKISEDSRIYLDRQCRLSWLKDELQKDNFPDEEAKENLLKAIDGALADDSPTMMDVLVDTINDVDEGSRGRVRIELTLE